VPTAAILNQERERWARHQAATLSASTALLSTTLAKQTGEIISASTQTASTSLAKQIGDAISAAFGFSGTTGKQTGAALSGTFGFSGSVSKQTTAVLTAAMPTLSASVSKQTGAALSATFGFVATTIKLAGLSLLASMGLSGSVIEQIGISLAANIGTFSSASVKQISAARTAVFGFSATVNKLIGKPIQASDNFAASNSAANFFNRAFNAVMQTLSVIWTAVKHPFVPPPVFQPITIGRPIALFGVTKSNPGLISMFSGFQLFARTGPPFPSFPATADGWGNPGQQAMGSELLVAPGNGCLSGNSYLVVAGGILTIPVSAVAAGYRIKLFENYFTSADSGISIQSDPLVVFPIQPVTAGPQLWSVVCRLTGNGVGNGILVCDLISINGIPAAGRLQTNRNPSREPTLQLSIGVEYTDVVALNLFQASLAQFELQQ
jgi:hypothetical protein